MVPVAVRFAGRILRAMCVLMMFVVYVKMVVVQGLVPMCVFVALRQMQPNARTHQAGGDN